MKRILIGVLAAALALASGCADGAPSISDAAAATETPAAQTSAAGVETESAATESTVTETAKEVAMIVVSAGIVNGYIDPAYGANGSVKEGSIPVLSLPLEISNAPEAAVCFAVYMDDPDAEPLCGYRWVHWMAVNIGSGSIPEDFSRIAGSNAVQGKNDNGTVGYAGPMPPDKDHTYVITVYALSEPLALSEGFSKEEFSAAIEGHVLASATLEGIYRK